MTGELVPFGKYKGQPVETLAADGDYRDWLMSQPWFRERWPTVYNVVINYGGEPQDSPEHNQMQAAFLDEAWCLALADRLGLREKHGLDAARAALAKDPLAERFSKRIELTEHDMGAEEAEFEVKGWDVVYDIADACISRRMTSLPGCTCRCDHTRCSEDARCRGGLHWCRHDMCRGREIEGQPGKVSTDSSHHCDDECPWRIHDTGEWLLRKRDAAYHPAAGLAIIRVELKPDLGDDYPSVLRQVNGYPHDRGKRCVVVRRAAFEHVTWDQVVRIFAASGITLLKESDLTAKPEDAALKLIQDRLGGEVIPAQDHPAPGGAAPKETA